jgi:DNA repair exonuclease SbcCD ATPase subunit
MTATFGCLNQSTLELNDGLNLLYASNESGKSTWCAFLLAMLYGLNTRARDKKGIPAEKNRYRPWNGAPMEGLLECIHGGKRIILRRSSENGVLMGNFSALYAETGETIPGLTGDNVGERLTGIGREVFERSLLIRQTNLAVDQSSELEHRIAALISSGDERSSWSEADSRLREWQRSRKYNKTGQIVQLENEALQLQERLSQLSELWQERLLLENRISEAQTALLQQNENDAKEAQRQKGELELRWAETAAELDAAQLQLQTLEVQDTERHAEVQGDFKKKINLLERVIQKRAHGQLIFSLFGLLLSILLSATIFLPGLHTAFPLPTILIAIALIGLLIVFGNLLRIHADKRSASEIEWLQEAYKQQQETLTHRDLAWESAASRERAAKQLFSVLSSQLQGVSFRAAETVELQADLSQMMQRQALLTGRLQELGDPTQLEAELETNRGLQKRLQEEYDAISEAILALTDAERELRARFSPELNSRTAVYFSRLTGGAYEKVALERDFTAKTQEIERSALRSALLLSQGTADQLYFALRLAICDLVLPKESTAPLILDDALASFDDHRAELALEILRGLSKGRQILLFTCHSREAKLLEHAKEVFIQQFKKC